MKYAALLLFLVGCALIPQREPPRVSPRQHAAACKLAYETGHSIPFDCPLSKNAIALTIRVSDDCGQPAPAKANEIVVMCMTPAEYRRIFPPPNDGICQ